jgi:hypothetical protein
VLNRAAKRNEERFPKEFRCQLVSDEWDDVLLRISYMNNLRF